MAQIDELARQYERHIRLPWSKTLPGAQRIIMIVYDKALERSLRGQIAAFKLATEKARKSWDVIDITTCFAEWMANQDYRDAFFANPEDLEIKLEDEFPYYVGQKIREKLKSPEIDRDTVCGVLGAGSLFGLTRLSEVLRDVEAEIPGRLAVFFPGEIEGNNYRLLEARDGWNYMATPITLRGPN